MGINKITVLLILTFSLLYKVAFCQEVLTPLHCNPVLERHAKSVSANGSERSSGTVNVDSAITLPFLDDFSYSQKYPYSNLYPTNTLWMDSEVYINDQYGINPPTVGVATFDGLNKYGEAYDTSYLGTGGNIDTLYGGADTLTSRIINLRESSPADSIYLSFFYQPGGNGDMPEAVDSFVLEFRDTSGYWDEVWSVGGGDTAVPPFKQVLIPVSNIKYFHPGFQFRFRNYAITAGNNDNWNLDYVKMDTARKADDTDLEDLAFQYNSQSILRNYSQMPWNQFYNYQSTELRDSFNFYIKNNYTSETNVATCVDSAFDLIHNSSIPLSQRQNAYNVDLNSSINEKFQTFTIPKTVESLNSFGDTIADISVRTNFEHLNSDEDIYNDTVYHDQYFENYYAYDNGIAETAYSLVQNGFEPELAYGFHLNQPDTLRAIQIFFPYANQDDLNGLLVMQVWSSVIDTGKLIYTDVTTNTYSLVSFVDSLNGFTTYVLQHPVAVRDSMYIGFLQVDANPVYIGFDVNDNDSENLHYNVGSGFVTSQFYGALMMRPVLGKSIGNPTSGIAPLPSAKTASLVVYPDPVKNLLTVKINNNTISNADLYIENMLGQTVISKPVQGSGLGVNETVDVSNLPAGMYFVRLMNKGSSAALSAKFVKTN